MNLSRNHSLILLHLIIIIWGMTGILGKLITMPSYLIVWNRMTIAFLCLFIINKFIKTNHNLTTKDYIKYLLIGCLISVHWICFFEAIKLSTVSLALICLSTISLFTAILDPIINNKKIKLYELCLSIIVTIGIVVIHNYENNFSKAIILSVVSAFFGALFTIFNHLLIQKNHKALTITSWEMLGGSIILTLYLISSNQFNISEIIPYGLNLVYILILGLICTAFAFVGSIEVMKKITPFTVNLSVNLEPIYTIIFALIIFGEEEKMSVQFYIGGAIILCSLILNSIIKNRNNN